ncbi:thiolase family protein [Anaeroselena agilis]|uniref:acetyl-CoA C-acetyltransferase n=1 Tax=Anaeroselena agilis TaxID=3063788 RepID=A0ABU3P341_9FIRM|nr:thiolase family protein [Selenomonadales bacterium 4137-cl]
MKDVVIVDACRTAVGNMGGSLKPLTPDDLARAVMAGILGRTGIEPALVDEVVLGHCRQSSDNPNIARLAALMCGIPEEVPAYTVMRQCASGMTAVADGTMAIQTGQNDIVLAGGTESMSNSIFYFRNARYGLGVGNRELLDSVTEVQFCSQPQDIYGRFNMGMTAENVAERMNISREDQDAFAYRSQVKAAAAIAAGRFKDEIVPVTVPQGRKKEPIVFDTDEFPRATSLEALAKLKPVFRTDGKGSVTAGNSSGRNDGASALLLMSGEKAHQLGLKPMAVIRGFAAAGVDPRVMGLGPIPATKKALKIAGLSLADIQLIELNEAFAAQSLGCIRELDFNPEIVNVNGGAIALGHPVGSSGSRIIVTLVHEMRRRGLKYGLATLCAAGGMGMTTIVEAV